MTGGEKIAKAAYEWLGTPHVNMAKVKGVGVDCGMLLIGTLEDAGLIKPGDIVIKPYSNEWHLHRSVFVIRETVLPEGQKADAGGFLPVSIRTLHFSCGDLHRR